MAEKRLPSFILHFIHFTSRRHQPQQQSTASLLLRLPSPQCADHQAINQRQQQRNSRRMSSSSSDDAIDMDNNKGSAAEGSNASNNNNSKPRRPQQKLSDGCSWRTFKKKRRQLDASSSHSTPQPVAAQQPMPLQLDQLPLNTLVIVASQLPFSDFKNIGNISKKFNTAQRMTRYGRKRMSVDLLRQLFPNEMPTKFRRRSSASNSMRDDNDNNGCVDDGCVGMLQVMRPLRKHLRSSPPRNIQEVDLSKFGSFRESHFDELFRSLDNGRELFAEVRRLNVQKCVMELKDMQFLAELMPKVWYIRCSAHSLVVPEGTEHHHKMMLNAEQMRQLRSKVENFVYVSQQCSKKHLWFLNQLTELFPGLEVVQLDN